MVNGSKYGLEYGLEYCLHTDGVNGLDGPPCQDTLDVEIAHHHRPAVAAPRALDVDVAVEPLLQQQDDGGGAAEVYAFYLLVQSFEGVDEGDVYERVESVFAPLAGTYVSAAAEVVLSFCF